MYEILLRSARIIDGGGVPAEVGDLALAGGRIVEIGTLPPNSAKEVIDLSGLCIAPGFIDVHAHSDGWLLSRPGWDVKVRQGFSTEVLMADGISYAPLNHDTIDGWFHYLKSLNGLERSDYRSWQSVDEYMQLLDLGCRQNVATHIPYANVRTAVCGWGCRVPSADQMREMQAIIREGIEQGAVGLSTGLEYLDESFAQTEELIEACRSFSDTNGLYVTHIRYPIGLLEGLKEAVEICEAANVALHVSHLKAPTPELAEELLHYIDSEARSRVDFSFDVYPYAAASTMLHYLLPYEIWEDGPSEVAGRIHDEAVQQHFATELAALDMEQTHIAWLASEKNRPWIGQSLASYAASERLSAVAAASRLLLDENLSVLLVFRRGGDDIVHPFLQHDCFMLGSDAVYFPEAKVHPRCFGSSARLLGECVRTHALFSLEEAVAKMSSVPARRFGLSQRGEIKKGYHADLVVFDERLVLDTASYENPECYPEGIHAVLVNGTMQMQDGAVLADAPLSGRYVKSTLGEQ